MITNNILVSQLYVIFIPITSTYHSCSVEGTVCVLQWQVNSVRCVVVGSVCVCDDDIGNKRSLKRQPRPDSNAGVGSCSSGS